MIYFLSPSYWRAISFRLIYTFSFISLIFISYGLYQALIISPEDYQQGEMVRIMYIHVPFAWMALGIYSFIAACSLITLVWQIQLAYVFALASAPIGATFSSLTLITGMLWGKPIWGIWWVWDARLTSSLILFLFYVSYIVVCTAGNNLMRAQKPACAIALLGFVNIPIVKFSVNFWYSLHQPASITRLSAPAIHSSMLVPLMLMFIGFASFFIVLLTLRSLTVLNNLKRKS